jgi:hypothetical protein
MGVIINETITLANGLTVTNPYASLGANDIRIEKNVNNNPQYTIEVNFTMWVSQALRESGSRDIGCILVKIGSNTPATGNIYELLYNKFKTMKTCTDSI